MAQPSFSPSATSSVGPTSASPPASTGVGGSMNRVISLAALAIAVAALTLTFVVPGPIGAQGPAGSTGSKGSTGPAGNGTIMSASSDFGTTSFAASGASGCTPYHGGNVTITAPTSGKVVVQAQVWVILHHDSSNTTVAYVGVSSTNSTCQSGPYGWPIDILPGAPTGWTNLGTFPQNVFTVSAGTYTFYVTGEVTVGWWPAEDVFWYDNIVAVFYPS